MLSRLLFAPAALHACCAFAQAEMDTNAYNGKWNTSIQAASGRPQAAQLVLVNFEGFWYAAATQICKGKKFPVTVQTSTLSQLEFTVWGSSISPSCPDISISVKPVSGSQMLEGTTANGEVVKLLRRR